MFRDASGVFHPGLAGRRAVGHTPFARRAHPYPTCGAMKILQHFHRTQEELETAQANAGPDDLHLLAPAESDSDASVSELLPSTNRRAAYPLFSVVVIKGILSFNKRIYRAEGGGGVMRGRSSGKTAPPPYPASPG